MTLPAIPRVSSRARIRSKWAPSPLAGEGWDGGTELRYEFPPTSILPHKGGGSLLKLARACSDNTHGKPG
jgi:hypothetical protein